MAIEKNDEIAVRINTYEQRQKDKLVQLGLSDKSYKHILSYLEAEIKQSTQMANFNYRILCFKNDGIYQLHKAIEQVYGVAQGKVDEGPSGGGGKMNTIDVTLADGTRLKVPYGKIALPDAGNGANIDIQYDTNNDQLVVSGSCEFRFSSMIDDVITRTQYLLTTESIYKHQAFELSETFVPKIIDLSTIDSEFMVLSTQTEYELQPLQSRIMFPKRCVEKGIPLKYGCLMEGPYGTGKTLLAFKLARTAVQNGWTFIYLKEPTQLARSLKLAKTLDHNGNGVIIFVEDIDQVTRGNRTTAMQDILNTLDGGDSKNMNVIALFTTNHIELIEPTFLRGKRIGSIISLGFLDAETAAKFIEFTFTKDGYEVDNVGLDKVCKLVAESNIAPAFMAEITESVKSHMIFAEDNIIKASYIENSVKAYLRQVELSRKKDMSETPATKLADSLKEVITSELMTVLNEVHDNVA